MSGASPSRAAVFSSSPQSVEIYEGGAWWPGSMLGWRHDHRGTCQAWVRVEFAGIVEDAWVDLALLRLPEVPVGRRLTLAREPKGAPSGVGTVARTVVVPPATEVTQTQQLPLVREARAAASGRRMPQVGGRRRAPEAGEGAAQENPAGPRAVDARPLGRHRAPGHEGRHRAADTGSVAPVDPAAVEAVQAPRAAPAWSPDDWGPSPSRAELPPAGPVVRPTSPRPEARQDLLTRPMRLEEGMGPARRSRRDTLTGV